MAKAKRPVGTQGAYRRNYPHSVRDKVDPDYLNAEGMDVPDPTRGGLTPKQWLAKFLDEHAAGYFRDSPLHKDPDVRRAISREKNAANRDLYAAAKGRSRLDSLDQIQAATVSGARRGYPPDGDWVTPSEVAERDGGFVLLEPTPSYLSEAAYKEALEAYREAIDTKPKDPARIEALRRVLAQHQPEPTPNDEMEEV